MDEAWQKSMEIFRAKNYAHFQLHGDLLFDNKNRLVLTVKPVMSRTPNEAIEYCSDLTKASIDTWRLPAYEELSAYIDPEYLRFIDTPDRHFFGSLNRFMVNNFEDHGSYTAWYVLNLGNERLNGWWDKAYDGVTVRTICIANF